MPYVIELADKGVDKALKENPALIKGLNVHTGRLTNYEVAKAFGCDYEEYRA
jgi:alanine dehydrogenase